MLLAALVVPLNRRLRPRLDRFFFPEQRELESGVEALFGEIEKTRDEPGLVEAMTRGLHALFRAERAFGYEVGSGGFATVIASGAGAAAPPWLAPEHPLVALLAERGTPLVLSPDAAGGARTAPAALGGPFLVTPLLLPVRRGKQLAAFVALGPKRSGDVYTASDLALLSAVCEAGARQLERLHAADELARERERRRGRLAAGAPARTPTSRARATSLPRATTCASPCTRSGSSPTRSPSACTTTRLAHWSSVCAAPRTRCARCSTP